MTNREFCLTRRKAERAAFIKVLKALPPERLEYRPDPKARTAGQLASLLTAEEAALLALIEKGEAEWKDDPPIATVDEMVAAYERDAAAIDERLAGLDDAAWEKEGRLVMKGGAAWADKLSEMFWGFLFDAVHHRGQLSTYLRPMGGKVPAIYGPSADDTGQ
jgi:uncharacterized damage-inducible protein DinB